MTAWPEWIEQRHEALLEHPVVAALSPASRRLYLALYSPRQVPRVYHPLPKLRAWAFARGVKDPTALIDELRTNGLALVNDTLEDVCFLHPDEEAILCTKW